MQFHYFCGLTDSTKICTVDTFVFVGDLDKLYIIY